MERKKEYLFSPFYEALETTLSGKNLYTIENVRDIYIFYVGYFYALKGNQILDKDLEEFHNEFDNFVHQVYGTSITMNWESLITFHTHNYKSSIEEFSKLLKQFRDRNREIL